jgi:pyruvate formate lyase activating enzyme
VITEIKRFATHDGPGIRTTIFLKGCPLRCAWCANPEAQRFEADLYYRRQRCHGSGDCVAVCPEGAISLDTEKRAVVDRARCTSCGKCVDVCPHAAFELVGRELSADELLAEAERDRPFYGDDGGLTLCGGEPLAQPQLAVALLAGARVRALGAVLDTCGQAPAEVFEEALRHTDLLLLDVKHADPEVHRRLTGVDNRLILENAERAARAGVRWRLSLPLAAGGNDDEQNLRATARLARELGAEAVDLLALHRLGWHKYRLLGRPAPDACCPEESSLRQARAMLEACGVRTTLSRMM